MCQHENFPCCGCGDEMRDELDGTNYQEEMMDSMCGDSDDDGYDPDYDDTREDYDDGMTDVEADADTLRSCGWGTDEDYYSDTPMGEDYGGE